MLTWANPRAPRVAVTSRRTRSLTLRHCADPPAVRRWCAFSSGLTGRDFALAGRLVAAVLTTGRLLPFRRIAAVIVRRR